MKKIALVILTLLAAIGINAQTTHFVGTLTIGDYVQHNVKATLSVNSHGKGTVTLYHIKIARAMPMHFDTTIPGVNVKTDTTGITTVTGTDLIPCIDNKPLPRYKVTNFKGTWKQRQVQTTCTLMGKAVSYSGKQT